MKTADHYSTKGMHQVLVHRVLYTTHGDLTPRGKHIEEWLKDQEINIYSVILGVTSVWFEQEKDAIFFKLAYNPLT